MKARALKWLRRILVTVLALVVVAVLAAITVLHSETGTRWVLEQIDRRVAGELRVDTFTGTLWSGIRIPLLTYKDAARQITAADLVIEFDWSQMSLNRLAFNDASANSIDYRSLATRAAGKTPLQIAMRPLPVEITLRKSIVDTFRYADNDRKVRATRIELRDFGIVGNRFTVSSASGSNEAGSIELSSASVKLDGDVPIGGSFSWDTSDSRWSGSGRVQGSLARLEFDHDLRAPYPATASGTVNLVDRIEPLVDVTVRWVDWRYGNYESEAGQASIRGWLTGYQAGFDFELSDQKEHRFRLAGSAAGDADGLTEITAAIRSPIGHIAANGSLQWSPSFSTDLRLGGQYLDLSQVLPIPETTVGADLTLLMSAPRDLQLTIREIAGTYMSDRFRGQGTVTLRDRRWHCGGCELAIGANRASLEGSIDANRLAMDLGLDAPILAQLWPGLSGMLRLDGTLRGTMTAPVFTGHASASSLVFANWKIGQIEVDSHESTIDQLDFAGRVEGVERQSTRLGSFDVSLQGAVAELHTRIGWTYDDVSGEALGTLDLSSQFAQGSIESARLAHPEAGTWQTANAFRFTTGLRTVEIGAHSWLRGDAVVRIDKLAFADGLASIDARTRKLPLEFLQFGMPESTELSGLADSNIRLTYEDGQWFGSLTWDQQHSRLRVHRIQEQAVDIEISEARLDARLLGDTAEATASMKIDPGISADLQLSLSPLSGDPRIDAKLVIAGNEWYWIPALVPEIDRFAGTIGAEIAARGDLRQPDFSGELRWHDGSLLVPAFNVPVTDIDVAFTGASDGAATVTGDARAGGGTISVAGRLDDLMQEDRSFTVRLSGMDAELINWTDYRITASPDVQITGNRSDVTISGDVLIPRADITVRRIPEETVSRSADVSVIGREEEPVAYAPITGGVEIALGKNVHVRALGLDTMLEGKLGIILSKNQDVRGEGELTLVGGVFEAYGQRLTITEGTLLFTGPLDDPIVNVRAVREIESIDKAVTAGIELRGRAKNLVATVFSEPAMAEADALSYLVLGRPLEQATTAEGNQLSGAAVALGLRQAGRITTQLGQAFGLDQLDVSGDGGTTTALVAGKQLSRRLYVRYAYGVFSQLGAFLLRYKLSRRWTLEASTGESHSMDILYLVEKP